MKLLFISLLICCTLYLSGCSNNAPEEKVNNYNTHKLSIDTPINNSSIEKNITIPESSKTTNEHTEETLSSFSTKISQKDPSRQKNITLACSALNGIVIKAGETFSFCDTLGPATPEKGYEKADSFDSDGNTIKYYGGGKCQVSTTIYNAVLAVPSLTVVERHEHSGPVYYVEEGMDACVSYGSCDFKFTNSSSFDIKMYVSNTPDSIDVSITKISS